MSGLSNFGASAITEGTRKLAAEQILLQNCLSAMSFPRSVRATAGVIQSEFTTGVSHRQGPLHTS
jgi:hypothetical protein